MDERLKKVTTVTTVTTVVTTDKAFKVLLFNILNHRLQPLQPFQYLFYNTTIHSAFLVFLNSYFSLCVELKNYRHGCNHLFNYLLFKHLQKIEVVTEVVTVVTKTHNYLKINKLRL